MAMFETTSSRRLIRVNGPRQAIWSFAVVLTAAIGVLASIDVVFGQTSCKVCADQQKACMKNYAGPTCKSEYKMCVKSCKK
ncbi:hypothetical protein CI1B_61270 [Bradyrhizobium ivorense]|uniref:Uncharacterized protein n=1 Tax=Bradyrhizobium ivorense TaxID=2511166 RepID=A0A508TNQ3_9BRAD|nr:hypothetical protein [Bradyrhizobium ivorense]VIO75426.1 hypothetical protein CI41S_47280 [Bradyrhizobium ivorense]VIO75836.1 hypothetical protein CI1B_61270 [Bradyrhizobium ivorense]